MKNPSFYAVLSALAILAALCSTPVYAEADTLLGDAEAALAAQESTEASEEACAAELTLEETGDPLAAPSWVSGDSIGGACTCTATCAGPLCSCSSTCSGCSTPLGCDMCCATACVADCTPSVEEQ